MTTARDFASAARSRSRPNPPPKYSWMGGYVVTTPSGRTMPQIVGRVFGGEGSAMYQIAARPHDEVSTGPFPTRQEAFNELIAELERRSKP